MKLHLYAWFNATSLFKYLLCELILNFLCVQSVSWTVWPNNFHPPHPHHVNSFPAWLDPTFNHHPRLYPHQAAIPEHYQTLPIPYHYFNSNNDNNNFPNYEYLSPMFTSQVETNANPLSLNQSSTAIKVSNQIVRHVSTKNKGRKSNLMLYQAPPSYDRIMDPPPSILITSRPFGVTSSTEKNSDFVTGEVKLATSPEVQFSPQHNIAVDTNNDHNWNTAVTLQVSLRPGSWTKSKRPTISDTMKQFLPELKHYKKGLKAVDVNQIKNKVEKYVLVSKKEPDMLQEMVTQPSITIMANDLIIYPQESPQSTTKDIKHSDEWDNDSEEEQESVHHEAPVMEKIEVFTPSIDLPSSTNKSNLTKTPSKSIEDIVSEVFATVTATTFDDEESEESSSQRDKGLSDLFDMIYSKNNNSNSIKKNNGVKEIESWLKLEPKKREQMNTTMQLITAPPEIIPLPELETSVTVRYESGNDVTETSTLSTSPMTSSVTTESFSTKEFHSEEVTIRCQGMWCHHSTPQPEPIALKSQQNLAVTGNEINPHDDDTHQIDPLLSYLGLAWPQHDRQSKTIQSTQPTNPPIVENVTTSTHKIDITEQLTSSSPLPLLHFRDNDVTNLIPASDNRPTYKELKDFKHRENDINASASTMTHVSREHLEAMFNALGHGIGQVMSVVMPLALPIQKENDLSVDFNSFF